MKDNHKTKTKTIKTQGLFCQFEYCLNVFTHAVTDLGSKISIPIYSELYITIIVNVCCNIYVKNSDFLMTVINFLNPKSLEQTAAPANIQPANWNSAITEKRGKVRSSR